VARKKSRKKGHKKGSPQLPKALTSDEKQAAMSRLGLTEADLEPHDPTCAYILGGFIVVGGVVLTTSILRSV
jgi:hypothetical protein